MIIDTILGNLLQNEQYARKVLPFLKEEYFQYRIDKVLYKLIDEYVHKYNSIPNKIALEVEASDVTGITEEESKQILTKIKTLSAEEGDLDWLIDQTEKFCQDKAVYNAIMDSIQILDGKGTNNKGSIPKILSDALAVSFDTHIGHDFLEDADTRFEFYHLKEKRVPFDLDYFNEITKGGLPLKTLNIALAGCVHPDTKIKVRISK